MSGSSAFPPTWSTPRPASMRVLALATSIVALLRWRNPGERYAELTARTDSWWWMIGAFTLCVLLNQTVADRLPRLHLLSGAEGISVADPDPADRPRVLLFAYLAIPIQFYWAAIDWYGMFIVFVPVWMFLFFPALMALNGETEGFLRAVGTLSWGLMMTVFTLEPHGVAAGVGRQDQPDRRRPRAAVLSGGADPVQRRGAVHLGQAHRPAQGDADRQPEKDLGRADRRRRHHHRRRRADRALPHADGLALVGAGRRDPRRLRASSATSLCRRSSAISASRIPAG